MCSQRPKVRSIIEEFWLTVTPSRVNSNYHDSRKQGVRQGRDSKSASPVQAAEQRCPARERLGTHAVSLGSALTSSAGAPCGKHSDRLTFASGYWAWARKRSEPMARAVYPWLLREAALPPSVSARPCRPLRARRGRGPSAGQRCRRRPRAPHDARTPQRRRNADVRCLRKPREALSGGASIISGLRRSGLPAIPRSG